MSDLIPEADADSVPALLPIQDDPLAADDAFRRFEESLDQRPDSTDLVVTQEAPVPVGRSWAYDFERHAFKRASGQSGLVETHDDSTLRQWIEHTLRVARGAHSIYSDDYGVDLPADFVGGSVDAFPLDVYERAVSEALLVHRSIASVEDFAIDFDPMAEWVAVSFTVVKSSADDENLDDVLRVENVRLG